MKYVVTSLIVVGFLFGAICLMAEEPIPEIISTETETVVDIPFPAVADEISPATITVEIPKAEYEGLKKEHDNLKSEIQKITVRRNQLLAENEALITETAKWRTRVFRILTSKTPEAVIEEIILLIQAEQSRSGE